MRLYLVQHGDALEQSEDPERPLSEAGRDDVERMRAFLVQSALPHPRIWHSGKRRAEETAEALAGAFRPPPPVEAHAGLGPKDPPEEIAAALNESEGDLMIVGHLPHLERLAALLLACPEDAPPVAFQKGGVLCLQQHEGRWQVAWMVVPEVVA